MDYNKDWKFFTKKLILHPDGTRKLTLNTDDIQVNFRDKYLRLPNLGCDIRKMEENRRTIGKNIQKNYYRTSFVLEKLRHPKDAKETSSENSLSFSELGRRLEEKKPPSAVGNEAPRQTNVSLQKLQKIRELKRGYRKSDIPSKVPSAPRIKVKTVRKKNEEKTETNVSKWKRAAKTTIVTNNPTSETSSENSEAMELDSTLAFFLKHSQPFNKEVTEAEMENTAHDLKRLIELSDHNKICLYNKPNKTIFVSENVDKLKNAMKCRRFKFKDELIEELNRNRPRCVKIEKRLNFLAHNKNLGKSMTERVYQDIIALLDPDSKDSDLSCSFIDEQVSASETCKQFVKRPKILKVIPPQPKTNNRYRRLKNLKKEQKTGGKKSSSSFESAIQEKDRLRLENVLDDFCNWVSSIGGRYFDVTPDYIKGKFFRQPSLESKYTKSPVYVRPQDIPEKIKASGVVPPPTPSPSPTHMICTKERQTSEKLNTKQDKCKIVYEDWWYLPKEEWKPLKPGDEIKDPKSLKEMEITDTEINAVENLAKLKDIFLPLYFQHYLNRKGVRRAPTIFRAEKVLSKIEDREIEKWHEKEEKRKSHNIKEPVFKGAKDSKSSSANEITFPDLNPIKVAALRKSLKPSLIKHRIITSASEKQFAKS